MFIVNAIEKDARFCIFSINYLCICCLSYLLLLTYMFYKYTCVTYCVLLFCVSVHKLNNIKCVLLMFKVNTYVLSLLYEF